MQPRGDEADCVVEEGTVGPVRHRDPGEALVSDPRVAIVVIAALLGALREAHGRGGDHRAGGARHAGQNSVSVPDIAIADESRGRRRAPAPSLLRRRPCFVGIDGSDFAPGRDRQHEVVGDPRLQPQLELQVVVATVADGARTGGSVPPEPHPAPTTVPHAVVVTVESRDALFAEIGPQREDDVDLRRLLGTHAPKDRHLIRTAGQAQRLSALDRTDVGDPPAPPDRACRLRSCHPTRAGPRDRSGTRRHRR